MNKLDINKKILDIFAIIYSIAICYELIQVRSYYIYTGEYYLNQIFKCSFGYSYLYHFLILILPIAGFLYRKYSNVFLCVSVMFFYVFKIIINSKLYPENAFQPYNQNIVFWIFLTMGLRQFMNDDHKIIYLIKFYVLFSYFAGGLIKIKSGLDWMNGWTLYYYLIDRSVIYRIPFALGFFKNLLYAKIASWVAIISELSVFLTLFKKKLEIYFTFFFITFQIFCHFILEIHFLPFFIWANLIYLSSFLVRKKYSSIVLILNKLDQII